MCMSVVCFDSYVFMHFVVQFSSNNLQKMTSKHVIVDVNDLETYEENIDEIGSSPSGPSPPSSSPKRKAN